MNGSSNFTHPGINANNCIVLHANEGLFFALLSGMSVTEDDVQGSMNSRLEIIYPVRWRYRYVHAVY